MPIAPIAPFEQLAAKPENSRQVLKSASCRQIAEIQRPTSHNPGMPIDAVASKLAIAVGRGLNKTHSE